LKTRGGNQKSPFMGVKGKTIKLWKKNEQNPLSPIGPFEGRDRGNGGFTLTSLRGQNRMKSGKNWGGDKEKTTLVRALEAPSKAEKGKLEEKGEVDHVATEPRKELRGGGIIKSKKTTGSRKKKGRTGKTGPERGGKQRVLRKNFPMKGIKKRKIGTFNRNATRRERGDYSGKTRKMHVTRWTGPQLGRKGRNKDFFGGTLRGGKNKVQPKTDEKNRGSHG